MNYRVLGSIVVAAAIAFARPAAYVAQEAGRAAEILALARQAIAGGKIDTLKTFSVQSAVQRNVGSIQLNSDVEILLDLPDKYLRSEASAGGPGIMIAGGGTSGFNGDRALSKLASGAMPGGGMVFRMGPSGTTSNGGGDEKPTAEQLAEMNQAAVRSARTDVSRLMLGWFAMAHPAAGVEYTYVGEAESPDGKAYVIDVKNADTFAARLFIDETTNLPLMVTYKAAKPRTIQAGNGPQQMTQMGGAHTIAVPRPSSPEDVKKAQADVEEKMRQLQRQPPEMADYTIFFDDWRSADGVKFPFKLRRAMTGDTVEEWTVSKVKVNPKIDAKKFAVDSGS